MRLLVACIVLTASIHVLAQESKIPINDGIIYLEVYGDGDPLLLINGGPGMRSEGFRGLAKKLSDTHQVILFDQRGTGNSTLNEVNRKTITLDLMVEDIETIRNYLNIEKWVVMGHSFGGMLASYYASEYPQNLAGLILSSSGGINMDLFDTLSLVERLSPMERDSLAFWNSRINSGDTTYYARLKRGMFLAPAYLHGKTHVPVVAERLTQGNMLVNGLVYQNMRAIAFDCSEGLKQFKAPTLIIQGKQDIIPGETAAHADRILENSTLVLLDQCAHYGWLEQPEEYFYHLKHFLGKLKS